MAYSKKTVLKEININLFALVSYGGGDSSEGLFAGREKNAPQLPEPPPFPVARQRRGLWVAEGAATDRLTGPGPTGRVG